MKKTLFLKYAVMAAFVVAAASCAEDPVLKGDGADCGGCEDPGPPIIKDSPPRSSCGDLVISSLTYSVVNNEYIEFVVEFKNTGTGIINDGSCLRQAYISHDANLDSGDAGAGGVVQSLYLTPGQSVTHVIQFYNPAALWLGKYIIVQAVPSPGSNDCNPNNNIAVIPI